MSGGSAHAPKVSCFSLAGVGIGIMCHALPFVYLSGFAAIATSCRLSESSLTAAIALMESLCA